MASTLYRPEEVAQVLGCGRTYVYALMASGQLESIKVGRLRRVPSDCVDAYVSRLRGEQSTPRPADRVSD
jgi:excisionase family DNA binding protein